MNKTFFGSDNVADFSGIDVEWVKRETLVLNLNDNWNIVHSEGEKVARISMASMLKH